MKVANRIVHTYFDALQSGNVATIPYADDVELWAPLGPDGLAKPIVGAAAVREFLAGVVPVIGGIEVLNVFENEDWCAGRALIELARPQGGVLHVFDVFRIRDGRIAFQENHYDPRPVLAE
jgi:ketosteroid isomerase-like protein